MNFINKEKLLEVLQKNCREFIDSPKLFKQALIDVRDTDYSMIVPSDPLVNTTPKITISKFELTSKNQFQVWVEFSIPHQEGTVIGTHIYEFDLDGTPILRDTYGTIFRTENEKT